MKTSIVLLVLLALPALSASLSAANPMRNLELGRKAHAFALTDERGKPRSLEDYRGRPVVLCYFRPGQPFSDKALSALARLSKRYSDKGAAFLGLWHKDAESDAKLPEVPFPLLDDGQRKFYGTYGLFILPTTAVLDKEHRLKAYFSSYHDGMEEEAAAQLDEVLGIREAKKPYSLVSAPTEDPRTGLARRLLKDGLAQEALSELEPALKAATRCDERLLAAEILLKLSRPAEARIQASECLKLEPNSPRAALRLGRALFLLGETGPAEELLKKAAAASPDPQAPRYLGDLYEKMGRKDEALVQYRAALERLLDR